MNLDLATQFDILVRLLVAAVLGAVVGIEREIHDHPAGMRTHLLVSVGSAAFTVLSIYGFRAPGSDPSVRVAAQIVTGIGFLGAGAILKEGATVNGLTTAASLWAVGRGRDGGRGRGCGSSRSSTTAARRPVAVAAATSPPSSSSVADHRHMRAELTLPIRSRAASASSPLIAGTAVASPTWDQQPVAARPPGHRRWTSGCRAPRAAPTSSPRWRRCEGVELQESVSHGD